MRQLLVKTFFLGLLLSLAHQSYAQLQISLEAQRDTFLLYEPIVFKLTVTNTSASPIALTENPGSKRPWLAFQIFRADRTKVSAVDGYSVPSQIVDPGQSTTLEVNITPLYRIRSSGQYDIQAVVQVPGGRSFITTRLRFHIGIGEVGWSEDVLMNGVTRKYSLIRFLESKKSALYLRVEEPDENLVYTTTRLGSVVGFTQPQVQFDANGELHILHISASTLHRYTHASAEGAILYREDRQALPGAAPRLVEQNGGKVMVAGGVDMKGKQKRRKLSEDQLGL
ncbi:MAG: hypothetical protein AAF558_02755 [Verrucomicrobiota bacterium]